MGFVHKVRDFCFTTPKHFCSYFAALSILQMTFYPEKWTFEGLGGRYP